MQKERCDSCGKSLQSFYTYDDRVLFLCEDCNRSAITCDSPRFNAKCASTSDGSAKLLAVEKSKNTKGITFVPGYLRYNNNAYHLCPECDTRLAKVQCSGNCGNWLTINNTSLGIETTPYVYGMAPDTIEFCTSCVTADSEKCGACGSVPVAHRSNPKETELFPGAMVSFYDGEQLYRCKVCVPKIISDGSAKKYYDLIGERLRELWSSITDDVKYQFLKDLPPLKLVGHQALISASSDPGVRTGILRGFWTNRPQSRILMEGSVPKVIFLSTEAHELTHAWQASLKLTLDAKTSEGFAQWVAYTLLKESGNDLKLDPQEVEERINAIATSTLANYGNGFRAFRQLEESSPDGRQRVLAAAMRDVDKALTKWNIGIPD